MNKPRVIDAISLAYEPDILLIRMRELADVVDTHVIIEGTTTFTGRHRNFLWPHLVNDPRFAEFVPKVKWHIFCPSAGAHTAWERDEAQRDATLYHAALWVRDDRHDRILLADCDEIPHPDAVRASLETDLMLRCVGRYHQLALDLAFHEPAGSQIWEFRQPLLGPAWRFLSHGAADIRGRQPYGATATAVGWHLTCMGGPQAVADKLRSYAHTELAHLTEDDVRAAIEHRWDIAGRGPLVDVPAAELPKCVQQGGFEHMMRKAYL